DRVELRGGDRVDELPRRALIVADVQPTIVSDEKMIAIVRVDPDSVIVAVRDTRLERLKRLAAVCRLAEIQSADVDDLWILRVDANLAVVHGAVIFITDDAPRFTFIV